jgi:rhomboid protease GluP
MFKRQTEGSVVCPSCGTLVGVNDDQCYSCGRRNPGMWGYAQALRRLGNDLGFVTLVVYGTVGLYVIMLLFSAATGHNVIGDGNPMGLLSPSGQVSLLFGASGGIPVFGLGMWWTVLSAGWLHGSALHILFNVLWIRQLGPATAEMYGAGRMVIIYTLAGAAGFLVTTLAFEVFGTIPLLGGAPLTSGASAPVFGLLGALVAYGRRGGSSMVGAQALQYALILGLMGLISPGRVDNWAHLGGFGGGYVVGAWLDPLRREKMDHLLWAFICLAATALAIFASIIKIAPIFRFIR